MICMLRMMWRCWQMCFKISESYTNSIMILIVHTCLRPLRSPGKLLWKCLKELYSYSLMSTCYFWLKKEYVVVEVRLSHMTERISPLQPILGKMKRPVSSWTRMQITCMGVENPIFTFWWIWMVCDKSVSRKMVFIVTW